MSTAVTSAKDEVLLSARALTFAVITSLPSSAPMVLASPR
jgi:hypothetical protein